MRNLGILCVTLFVSSCSLLFSPESGADRDGGTPAIDGSTPPSDAMVTDAGVDANTLLQIVPTGTSMASDFVGSSVGGSPFVDGGISCPETSILYGVQISTYQYSDDSTMYMCQLQALCATLQIEAGEVKRVHHSIVTPKPDVGNCANVENPEGPFRAVCPEHSVATGIILSQSPGPNDTVIKAFTQAKLQCATIDPQLSFSNSRFSPPAGSPGHTSSTVYRTDCSTSMVATEINGRAGESIDQISFSCRGLQVPSNE